MKHPMKSRFSSNPVRHTGQGLFIGLLCVLLLWTVDSLLLTQGIERTTLDALFHARGVVYPSPDIVLVEANDATITRYSWPLPRGVYSQLIEKLTRAGAKTIAFDVLFPTDSGSQKEDQKLIKATQVSGRVIHSAVFNLTTDQDSSIPVGLKGNAGKILPRFRLVDQGVVCSSTVWGSAALPALQRVSAGLGLVNAPPEDDGVLRRIPNVLRFRTGDKAVLYPSLALAAAAHFLDVKPNQILARRNEIILPAKSGTRHIPLDVFGRTYINWVGKHETFRTYSFNDVLDDESKIVDKNFKDKIVLIGIAAAGSYERHATPFSSNQPAVELQANALDDILMQRSLHWAPNWWVLLLALLFPALIGAVTLNRSAKMSGLITLGLCLALWLMALGALTRLYVLMPVATPIMASLLTWGVGITFRQWRESQQLRQAEERYALAVRGANDGLWDWDIKANQMYYSPRWKAMLGYDDEEIGSEIEAWYQRVHPDDLGRMQAQLDAHLSGGVSHFESQHRIRHRDGHWIWVLARGLRVCDASGKPTRMAGSLGDISLQVESREQLERNAFYDTLTGLPNRALFMNMLDRAVARTQRNEAYQFAVMFLDLDRFKLVNDSLGHGAGDDLLISVARRIEACLRPGDTVARLSGDEFIVLLDELDDLASATRLADQIHQTLTQPFSIGNQEIFSTASIGIALSDPAYHHGDDLLRDADTAMYRAKSLGHARQAVFDEEMHAHSLALLRLETDLRRALERQDLLVFYQPIVRLDTGEITGFEALVRWNHAERGMISPGEFIGLAEETGLIIAIDHLVLREACVQMRRWQKLFPHQDLSISVNLSSKQFTQTDLVAKIRRTLDDTGLPPTQLKLEITEGVLMDNPEKAAALLRQLRDLGIRLSIDDFGTGYSSLSYLHRFPLDTLKVDQSFIKRIQPNGENSEIVRTIVALARNLNMDVVAEGVETREQMELLREMLCDCGQGYLFAKPLHVVEAEVLLTQGIQGQALVKNGETLSNSLDVPAFTRS